MVNLQVLKSPVFIIKVVELILGIVCVALSSGHVDAYVYNYERWAKTEVVHATYYGFLMISLIVILCFILETPVHPILMMVVSGAAAVMYITSGALNIQLYDKGYPGITHTSVPGEILGAGITALINSIVYAVDVFLSWKHL